MGVRLEVAAATIKLGDTSFEMRYEVRGGELVLATGKAVLVFVDEALRPRRIPDDVRDAIVQFEEMKSGA
jgi:acyl-CoA thioesterase FadM